MSRQQPYFFLVCAGKVLKTRMFGFFMAEKKGFELRGFWSQCASIY